MAKLKLKGKNVRALGYPQGKAVGVAVDVALKNYRRNTLEEVLEILASVLADPKRFLDHKVLGRVARELVEPDDLEEEVEIPLRDEVLPYQIFGSKYIDSGAKDQIRTAMQLPVTRAGALMPDAHTGYGLPIGGVLATENSVIPFGVGVDIGCRMCLTVYNIPTSYIGGHRKQLQNYLKEHTKFGMKDVHKDPADHAIFERKEFQDIALLRGLKAKARRQLGTSGGGNHFVEFGEVELLNDGDFDLPAGKYMAILSHSGSRGLGANVAQHYTQVAMNGCPLPKQARHLAYLSLDSQEGQEYWLAMNLAGDYASACHHDIHRRLSKALGEKPAVMVENHHNFAWKEQLPDGTEVIVHRKGATPASEGALGIIPGSMTAPGYIVRGKGNPESINSAAHGAGRQMSRKKAKNSISGSEMKKVLKEHGVSLIGGGLDEAPGAYKDIRKVMSFQKDMVEVLGTFHPKIVRMEG